MMNEEEYIKKRMGSKNPFTVPEGYFEQLSSRIMSQLPADEEQLAAEQQAAEQSKPARVHRLRPWLAAASVAAVAVISVTIFLGKQNAVTTQQEEADALTASYYSDTYIDEEADYAMVDNQDIYAFLLADI